MLADAPADQMVKVSFPVEYTAIMPLENAVVDACFKLDISILEKHVTGVFFKTMYLRLEGTCGNMLKFARWAQTLET